MRYIMRRQKERDIYGVKAYPSSWQWWISTGQVLDLSALMLLKAKIVQACFGVIFFLLVTLFLVVVSDTGSADQVGLHWPLLPQTIHNLLATSKFNYSNVYSAEEGMRAKRRENSISLTAPGVHLTSIPKPGNNSVQHKDFQVMNQESGNRQGKVRRTDSSPRQQNDAKTTGNSGGHSPLYEDQTSRASSVLVAQRDHSEEFQYTDQGKGWIHFPHLIANETEKLVLQIKQNGTLPCHYTRTQSAQILGLPQPSKRKGDKVPVIRLHAGPVHEFTIISIGDDGQPRCAGGDYYETDLSGPLWKSRPPVLDHNNGTYSVRLQMDPRFTSGVKTFKVILLFTNFHALHFHPQKWARMEEVSTYQIQFELPESSHTTAPSAGSRSEKSPSANSIAHSKGPKLPMCTRQDFNKKYWSGRWTRENATSDCEYDRHGRWKCVDLNLKCRKPWCKGLVGHLESNGWVYSAHCAFKIFQKEEAWKCLDRKWLFFWGDSNHVDTIRNLLNFVLGFDQKVRFLDRRMDTTYFSPPNNRSSVRITSMFNGHSNATMNYEGLFSLHDPVYAQQLRSYFTEETTPDFMIMNSGLHDGLFWKNMGRYMEDGVEYAANFWAGVWNEMKGRRPDLLYRTTITTGGGSRNMSFNPHKMELFNHLMVDKFLRMELERFQIIDGFDYTYPWHFDHKTNDGVHYGRPPSKTRWAGGNIGHRYFVDLMLVHMLLNAICSPSLHGNH